MGSSNTKDCTEEQKEIERLEENVIQLNLALTECEASLDACRLHCSDASQLENCMQDLVACRERLQAVERNASNLFVYPQAFARDAAGFKNPETPEFEVNQPLTLAWQLMPLPSTEVAQFNVHPDLPGGLFVDDDGFIVGTPTETRPEQEYAVTLDLNDAPPDAVPLVTTYLKFAIVDPSEDLP